MGRRFLHEMFQYRWWALGMVIGLATANFVVGRMMWTLTVGIVAGSLGAIVAAEARTSRENVVRDERSSFLWTQSVTRLLFVLLFLVPAVLTAAVTMAGRRVIPTGFVFLYLLACIIVIAVGFTINGRH